MSDEQTRKTRRMPTLEERRAKKAERLAELEKAAKDLQEKLKTEKRELAMLLTPRKSQKEQKVEAARLCMIAKCILKQIELGNLDKGTFDGWMDAFLTRPYDRRRYYGEEAISNQTSGL